MLIRNFLEIKLIRFGPIVAFHTGSLQICIKQIIEVGEAGLPSPLPISMRMGDSIRIFFVTKKLRHEHGTDSKLKLVKEETLVANSRHLCL